MGGIWVTIIPIICGVIPIAIELYNADITEEIFYTKTKQTYKKMVQFIVLTVWFFYIIITSALLLSKNWINISILKTFETIIGILLVAFTIVFEFVAGKVPKRVQENCIVIATIAEIILGIIGTLKIKFLYLQNWYGIAIIVAMIISLMSVFMAMHWITIVKKKKDKLTSCWIEYDEGKGKKKYYLYHAIDNEYMVCGSQPIYKNNSVYKYIKIEEIKENYLVHIDKQTSNNN